ncbi:MAG: hypothetical protein F4045_02120 [Chloroflexi bacterium]|nr:hypothetical protein [Chloroflexota bacterium]MYK33929.1 hypothetical protein [Chloroflexota bacterium]
MKLGLRALAWRSDDVDRWLEVREYVGAEPIVE